MSVVVESKKFWIDLPTTIRYLLQAVWVLEWHPMTESQ